MSYIADFDLNIEKVLEAWTVSHAIREFIANALDEQALSASEPVQITKSGEGVWAIQDFGRGLRHTHLTLNESVEKHARESEVMGRFGVGLKDALAVLSRRGVDVGIQSAHCEITLVERGKAGFSDVRTLHARIAEPSDRTLRGTRVVLRGVSDQQIAEAKRFFLAFSGDACLGRTRFGEILKRDELGPARIYVKGLVIAEEENFAFSYNITSLTEPMRRALNRERTNVGRGAYSGRIKDILLASESAEVAEVLADDLAKLTSGASRDEVRLWTDVGVRAAQVLNASRKVLFVTSEEMWQHRSLVDLARADGCSIIVVPDLIRTKLDVTPDLNGNPIQSIQQFTDDWKSSFRYEFVPLQALTLEERSLFLTWPRLAEAAGGLPARVREVAISTSMRPTVLEGDSVLGVWEPDTGRIIIRRDQLRASETFVGVFLHELAHARSGASDVSREFEIALTEIIGLVGRGLVSSKPFSDQQPISAHAGVVASIVPSARLTDENVHCLDAVTTEHVSGSPVATAQTPAASVPASILEVMAVLSKRMERVSKTSEMAQVYRDLTALGRFNVDATPNRLPKVLSGLQALAQAELEMVARTLRTSEHRVVLKPTAATAFLNAVATGVERAITTRPERERAALRALVDEMQNLLATPQVLAKSNAYSGITSRVAELIDVMQS